MHDTDILRELNKIFEALDKAVSYHCLVNQSNAVLHLSDNVMLSPLTTKLISALNSASNLFTEFEGRTDEPG